MSQVFSIRISDEIANELENIADETERAKAFHINKAIEAYIQNYADIQIALDRLNNPNDEIISSDEMREMLEL